MQAEILSTSFYTAQTRTHSCNPAFHSAPSLHLLLLTTPSEISEFDSNTCAPYPTQFWVKVQFYHHFRDFFEDWNISVGHSVIFL